MIQYIQLTYHISSTHNQQHGRYPTKLADCDISLIVSLIFLYRFVKCPSYWFILIQNLMAKRRKNILLITSDQWRADCLSAFDHPCVQTPHYDALIKDGIAFRNHYSVCAPCGPARASLLTGMYMQNHRSVRNGTPLDDRHTNIAREARQAGYSPTLFGYTDTSLDHRSYSEAEILKHGYENLLPGFDEGVLLPSEQPTAWLESLHSQGYTFENADAAFSQLKSYPGSANRGRTFAPVGYKAEHSQTAFLTQSVIDYIESENDSWFVHLSYFRPHPPFAAPEPYHNLYDPDSVPMPIRMSSPSAQASMHPWFAGALGPHGDWTDPWIRQALETDDYDMEVRQIRATYYGLVSKVDHYFGKLVASLKELGQYEDTLIIVTSDHGELLGDQWLFGKRGFFDTAYQIPLLIKCPDQHDDVKGRIFDQFTESIDLMPTILDWIGVDSPRQCDGTSLLPFTQGIVPHDWRSEVHWEYDFRDIEDTSLERELGIALDECHLNVIRNHQFKYVHFPSLPPLFFDLINDPSESRNLANETVHTPAVLELSQKMLSWRMRNDERTLTSIYVSREKITDRFNMDST